SAARLKSPENWLIGFMRCVSARSVRKRRFRTTASCKAGPRLPAWRGKAVSHSSPNYSIRSKRMAINNHERVGKAMELLKQGLGPFVDREFKNQYGDRAAIEALRFVGDDRNLIGRSVTEWDVAALLKLMWEAWNSVFRRILGSAERSLVSELRDLRNKWAHQE